MWNNYFKCITTYIKPHSYGDKASKQLSTFKATEKIVKITLNGFEIL
jgi:hypothetical protein